jgi:hypothetical protein
VFVCAMKRWIGEDVFLFSSETCCCTIERRNRYIYIAGGEARIVEIHSKPVHDHWDTIHALLVVRLG